MDFFFKKKGGIRGKKKRRKVCRKNKNKKKRNLKNNKNNDRYFNLSLTSCGWTFHTPILLALLAKTSLFTLEHYIFPPNPPLFFPHTKTTMASTFSHISLSLLSLLLLPFFSAAFPNNDPLQLSSTPKLQAEKFIRDLNLFPIDEINTVPHKTSLDEAFAGPMLVEKQFKMPFLGAASGPSVQELGHHAGYYRLPNSKAAR